MRCYVSLQGSILVQTMKKTHTNIKKIAYKQQSVVQIFKSPSLIWRMIQVVRMLPSCLYSSKVFSNLSVVIAQSVASVLEETLGNSLWMCMELSILVGVLLLNSVNERSFPKFYLKFSGIILIYEHRVHILWTVIF